MQKTPLYPEPEFLRDFHEWQKARPKCRDAFERARMVLSMQYHPDLQAYVYRVNRFICILRVIHAELPKLVQDRVALKGGGEMDYFPKELLLALLGWYCEVPESEMNAMPDPDWPTVLSSFDQRRQQLG